jgi:hypothetical protein
MDFQNLTEEDINSMNREQAIKWLCWNDPHGIYTDEDSKAEGLQPITLQEAKIIIRNQSEE